MTALTVQGGDLMRNHFDKAGKVAVIRCLPGREGVKYPSKEERHEAWRYHTILLALQFHGAQRFEAEAAAKWVCRKAEPGDKREIWPGIEITIEEQEAET